MPCVWNEEWDSQGPPGLLLRPSKCAERFALGDREAAAELWWTPSAQAGKLLLASWNLVIARTPPFYLLLSLVKCIRGALPLVCASLTESQEPSRLEGGTEQPGSFS